MFKVNIHCKTKEQAVLLLEYLDKQGFKWVSKESLLEDDNWEKYKENTCYYVNPHLKTVEYNHLSNVIKFGEPLLDFMKIAEQIF